MRGGFVACSAKPRGHLEGAAARLRWHGGEEVQHRHGPLAIAALRDSRDGPHVEIAPRYLRLTHGGAPAPLSELQANCGRFAALDWDGSVLRAVRDPLGLAPLFYRAVDGAMWLATEMSSLLGIGPDAPNLQALSARAAFAPMDEETGWEGIRRVLPGCTLEIGSDLSARSLRYWDPERLFGTYRGSRDDAVGEVRERLRRAVARSFEPGGAVVLSGGQDSAAVAVSIPAGNGKPHLVHAHFSEPSAHGRDKLRARDRWRGRQPLHEVAGEVKPWTSTRSWISTRRRTAGCRTASTRPCSPTCSGKAFAWRSTATTATESSARRAASGRSCS
jgi:hypothetical protein